MTQPLDRGCKLPEIGKVDREAGELWVGNPFALIDGRNNLSAYERNRLYLNRPGEAFVDASFASRVDIDSDSRTPIAADFDRDGAPDLLVGSAGGGVLRLFRNRFPDDVNRVRFELVGTHSNRAAIGTRLIAYCGDRQIVRDVFASNPCQGMAPVDMLVGIGNADAIDRLEVRWPDGQRQEFVDLPADRQITITEGSSEFQVGPLALDASASVSP